MIFFNLKREGENSGEGGLFVLALVSWKSVPEISCKRNGFQGRLWRM